MEILKACGNYENVTSDIKVVEKIREVVFWIMPNSNLFKQEYDDGKGNHDIVCPD